MLCLPWALTGRCGSRGGLVVGLGAGVTWEDCWLCLSVRPSVCLSGGTSSLAAETTTTKCGWPSVAMGLRDRCTQ